MDMLQQIKDRLAALPALRRKQQQYADQIYDAQRGYDALRREYTGEQGDVERLQKEGLSAFLLRMAGRYEKKMEKELREAFEAKEAVEDAAAHLQSLQEEKQEVDRQVQELTALEQQYKQELEQRRLRLSQSLSGSVGMRYAQLEEERQGLISQITEIDEALRVAQRAMSCAGDAEAALDKADSWATYDVFFKGGILTHAAKYSHIDNADACFHRLSALLRELRAELADVHDFASPQFEEVSSGQRAVDFWFDNIFTDYSVRSKVRDNAGRISQLRARLGEIQGRLRARRAMLSARLDANLAEEEHLLVSL